MIWIINTEADGYNNGRQVITFRYKIRVPKSTEIFYDSMHFLWKAKRYSKPGILSWKIEYA